MEGPLLAPEFASRPAQQIAEAMRIFSEIQVALADKSLTEMASNKFVQDKLKEVLHLEEVLKEVVLVVMVEMVVVMEVVEVRPHY